ATSSEQVLAQQRAWYEDALKALGKGQRDQFEALMARLSDYPLQPYLRYYDYKNRFSTVTDAQIKSFLTAVPDSVVSERLRNMWLRRLAQQQRWSDVAANYSGSQHTEFKCYYNWALFQNGQRNVALDAASALWMTSQPDNAACASLFSAWKLTPRFNKDLILQRINLALNNKRPDVAGAVAKDLSDSEQQIVEKGLQLYNNPGWLVQNGRYANDSILGRLMVAAAFKHLASSQPERVNELWPLYARLHWSKTELAELTSGVALNLAANRHPDADGWLEQALTNDGGAKVAEIAIRYNLRQQNWVKVDRWLKQMTPQQLATSQWTYWRARTQQELGADLSNTLVQGCHYQFCEKGGKRPFLGVTDTPYTLFELAKDYRPSTARDLFLSIADERSFYGFMASTQLQIPLAINDRVRPVSNAELKAFEGYPAIRRARELYLLGKTWDSRSEWNFAVKAMSADQRGLAASLADSWGWYNQAAMTAQDSTQKDNLALRFPRPYVDTVKAHAFTQGIGADWVYGVIRQESAFLPEVKSPAGAIGMMQLMPATAKLVAKGLGINHDPNKLTDVSYNVRLGSAYLKEMLDFFDGNTVLATAAYNAGPGRVKKWQPETESVAGDIWVETIPIQETRDYVKAVTTFQAIYRHRLGSDPKMTPSLASIAPRGASSAVARNDEQ
ncbi:MAG TPA: transglycosylase SLT domain-containing protein, partial [Pseudomonadales bacterium]|nr:transglycosylase SLT domain-containing protein [Pseudomonadales bacterium]